MEEKEKEKGEINRVSCRKFGKQKKHKKEKERDCCKLLQMTFDTRTGERLG